MGDATDNSDGHPGRLRPLLAWLPHWAVALLLLLPVFVIDTFDVLGSVFGLSSRAERYPVIALICLALVLPGPVKRLNWRHVLMAPVIGPVVFAVAFVALPYLRFRYGGVLVYTAVILGVGIGEWALTSRWRWRSLIWVLLLSVAGGCVLHIAVTGLWCCAWELRVPPGSGGARFVDPSALDPSLIALFTWVLVPAALRLGRLRRRVMGFIGGAAVAVCAAAVPVFFEWGIYAIAERSIGTGGIFHSARAASLLADRGRESDFEVLRRKLKAADWSIRYGVEMPDWREMCIRVLAERDPKGTAELLSGELAGSPTSACARLSAEILAAQGRYETAPILMRYALLHGASGCSECGRALEAMRLPRVSLRIICNAAIYDRLTRSAKDFAITSRDRERLTRLLGKDAGPNLSHWIAYYDEVIPELPTPLPPSCAREMDRVIQCAVDYWQAQDSIYWGKRRLMARHMREDGRRDLERIVIMTGVPVVAGRDLQEYYDRATADLGVQEPNLDVPTTDDLRGEIDQYVDRVNRKLRQYHLATSQPGTIPHGGAPKRN